MSFIRKVENWLMPARGIRSLAAQNHEACHHLTSTVRGLTKMQIRIERDVKDPKFTAGKLYVDGQFVCYTLEDPVREKPGVHVDKWKIYGDTAIPQGKYPLIIKHSPQFNKDLPRLENVPGFEGVLIHSGNTIKDTKGCILVGIARDVHNGVVVQSRDAMALVFKRIKEALDSGKKVELEIV